MMNTDAVLAASTYIQTGRTFKLVGNPSYYAVKRLMANAREAGYTVTDDLIFTAPEPFNEMEAFISSNRSLIQETLSMQFSLKELEERLRARKEALLALMEKAGIRKVETPAGTIRLHTGGNYDIFDTKVFKQVYPKLFQQYSHAAYRDDYLKVTVKK
jgi:hypothetical protein